MDKRKIEKQVSAIAQSIAQELGVSVLDTQYEREHGQWYLRIYIEKPSSGITIDDCADLSRSLDAKLDEMDHIFAENYLLEVSSSGDMPIRYDDDYEKLKGKWALINTYKSINGKNKFEGWLLGRDENDVLMKVEEDLEEKSIAIPIKNISKARLAVPFTEVPKNVSK